MTTKEFVKILAQRLEITQRETRALLKQMNETIAASLVQRETMILRGFGSFGTRKHEPRRSFHPTVRKYMMLPPKITIFFRPSPRLKQNLAARRES